MAQSPPTPEIRFKGARARRKPRAALLVLHGAAAADVGAALRWARAVGAPPLVVAVDGGLRAIRRAGLGVDLYVGDQDSFRGRSGAPEVVFEQDKDFSDLAGALREAAARGAGVVTVAGLIGGRLDHEWANLLELGRHASAFRGILAPSRRGLVAVTAWGLRAAAPEGTLVSVFALGGAAEVSLRGARWTLRRRRLRPGSHGLSNRVTGDFDLTVHRGVAAVVFPQVRPPAA